MVARLKSSEDGGPYISLDFKAGHRRIVGPSKHFFDSKAAATAPPQDEPISISYG